MLLEFKVKNFKSFCEEAVFTMMPAPKQKGLDYSVCKEKYKGNSVRGLCSSVIYGPNAAGKTNIIQAMDVLRSVILRGNIKNADDNSQINPAASNLELIPNNECDCAEPVSFYIDFTEQGMRFQYQLVLDLGEFLDESYERKILLEELRINEKTIFSRNQSLYIDMSSIPNSFSSKSSQHEKATIETIAESSLNPEELFLCNGFKLVCSSALYKVIADWFTAKFMVICHADSPQLIKRFADPQKKGVYVEKTVQKAAALFGIDANLIGYVTGDDEAEPKLVSIFKKKDGNAHIAVPSTLFESYGSIRFINIFPLIIRAIMTGATLVVDEFDASIHPMALMNIVNIFHNDEINVHHAQLIFNTHNPIFLNSNLLRRDEIKFAERDGNTHQSSIYALSDFGTAGENGVRKNEDYLKNYFVSRYGAIKDIDFTPIFEELIAKERETE